MVEVVVMVSEVMLLPARRCVYLNSLFHYFSVLFIFSDISKFLFKH